MRKPVFVVSDQVRHKLVCAATEDGHKLEMSDFRRRELCYLCSENKGADQLCCYCTAYLQLCFRICKNPVFLMMRQLTNTDQITEVQGNLKHGLNFSFFGLLTTILSRAFFNATNIYVY